MAKKELPIFDFDNSGVRKMVGKYIDGLRGLIKLEVSKCKDQRSLDANAYYWGVCLPHIAHGMSQAWGESIDSDNAHEFLKDRFLKNAIIDRGSGEVMGYTAPSTAALDTAEFGEYLDNIIKFAAEQLEIEIPIALRRAEVMA